MRHFISLRRWALPALVAGSLTAACHVQAANDFEALLAEVSFGQEPAGEPLQLEPAAEAGSPSDAGLGLPPAAEALPEPPASEAIHDAAPVAQATPVPAAAMVESCGECQSGHCGSHHGVHEAYCQPYVPPRLPTSTFYQYWRSNSCNTQVWNGFRNRCHQCIDLTVKPKSHHGCLHGKCDTACAAPAGDCGPLPEEWVTAEPCDSCD